MCKIKIDLDRYKEFFGSECGLKLITEIVDSGDYDAVRGLSKWSGCTSSVLDRIASKYMSTENIENNLKVLEDVAEHPRISVKTLEKLFDFASGYVGRYRGAVEVLEEIAESKKISQDIAWKLYDLAVKWGLIDVIGELAENSKTPDEIIFAILDTYKEESKQYLKACKQITKRYKKLVEQHKVKENK